MGELGGKWDREGRNRSGSGQRSKSGNRSRASSSRGEQGAAGQKEQEQGQKKAEEQGERTARVAAAGGRNKSRNRSRSSSNRSSSNREKRALDVAKDEDEDGASYGWRRWRDADESPLAVTSVARSVKM